MKPLKYVSNVYIDEDSILHWTEKHWYDDTPTDYTWNVSNEELLKHYDLLPRKICQILLMTDEFHWTKGDGFSNYLPEVYHCCWKTIKTKPDARHMGNVDSNPCYGSIKIKDCDDSVFTKIGKYKLQSYRSWGTNELQYEIECPRCRSIWAIRDYIELCPWKIKFYGKVMGFFSNIYYFKIRVFFKKTGISHICYMIQKAFARLRNRKHK